MKTALELFPQRIPEPDDLNDVEMNAFQELAQMNYKRWFNPLVLDFIEQTGLDEGRVMDLACGPGFLSKELKNNAPNLHIVALDNSDESLRMARSNLSQTDVEIVNGSVYEIPFPNDSFDAVICKDSLHHFNDVIRAFQEIYRIVKPGGYIYINDLRRDLPLFLAEQARGIISDVSNKGTKAYAVAQLQYYSARAAYTMEEIEHILIGIDIKPLFLGVPQVSPKVESELIKADINIDELRKGNITRYTLIVRK
jgi:ubiquinone/menaquinone biosynthesis C-methylase UbiE